MSQLEIELQLLQAEATGRAHGTRDVLDALRVRIDSMKSDSQNPTAFIMNSVLEEVYTKTIAKLEEENR